MRWMKAGLLSHDKSSIRRELVILGNIGNGAFKARLRRKSTQHYAIPAGRWVPHSLWVLSSWLQAAVCHTFGSLARKMLTECLLSNAEDSADSDVPRRRHRRYDFAEVWLGNLENIQLCYN